MHGRRRPEPPRGLKRRGLMIDPHRIQHRDQTVDGPQAARVPQQPVGDIHHRQRT